MPQIFPQTIAPLATWTLCILVFLLILWRPRRIPEYAWAAGGAALLVGTGLLTPLRAGQAVAAGTSVYLFLAGMMLLAELARQHGVFDWLASRAMEQARGSQSRLFALVYAIGILVTALLSNDATAVLLTPAVLAVVRRARTEPLPYLFACAFIANAASFLLPISNPANLVVFDGKLPALTEWLRMFLLPACGAVAVTFGVLRWRSARTLSRPLQDGSLPAQLGATGRRAAVGVLVAAAALLITSALGGPIGPATLAAGVGVLLLVARTNRRMMTSALAGISWGVLPLVGGLFVLVEALKSVGALALCVGALETVSRWPAFAGLSAAAFSAGIGANAINNLPMGLIAASAVKAAQSSRAMHAAVLLGINLGPNLSVTGSLATILWLMALRRENIDVSGWQFLREGALIMPPAMLAAIALLVLTLR